MLSQRYDTAYMRGWNDAGAGKMAHENPFPNVSALKLDDDNNLVMGTAESMWKMAGAYSDFIPGQTRWNLWLSGWADYMASPFNCEAQSRYAMFKNDRDVNFFAVESTHAKDENNIDQYSYADGSYVKLTDAVATVFNRLGVSFIQLDLA